MVLKEQVARAFAPGSALSCSVEAFQPRAGQTEMALAIAETIDSGGLLVVEAGTGVGKTYSYLVPALLSGARVLISTATKTLQDQLYARDLPQLVAALGLPLRTALLKGRSSYLCIQRLETARQASGMADRFAARTLAKVEQWALRTRTGDLAELEGLDERSPVLPLVTSTRDNCLGAQCPHARACHVNLARREALAADAVVINHHLFFADMAVRESGVAELLPTVQTVVFDEAHQINETGLQFLGRMLGTGQVLDFASDLLAAGLQQARGTADWNQIAGAAERAARDLRMVVGRLPATRLAWPDASPQGVDSPAWSEALAVLKQTCVDIALLIEPLAELGPDFQRLAERANGLATLAESFLADRDPDAVRWLDVGTQLRLVESPLDIAKAMQERLLKPMQEPDNRRSWIFTSATLGDEAHLRWFTEPCGLEQARTLQVQSPFDYPSQAALYVPRGLPRPADPGHAEAVAALAGSAALQLGGRTMVLTTTLRALRTISEKLQAQCSPRLDVLVQGSGPKRELMERLRNATRPGARGCILVGSASFWEGVDVPGDALQLVVIDKLPFPPPNDPLVEARANRLKALGRSAFNDYFLPEAAVALKQGAGRLIRRESDQGLLLLCDTRLVSMAYGRRLLAALPPMRRLLTEEDWTAALEVLTRPSTTA